MLHLIVGTARLRFLLVASFALVVGAINATPALAATYALEIIQPRAGLTTANRYYRAYPGLRFDVQIAAIGGTWPYRYTLVSGPEGMSVDPDSGVLTWTPSATGAYPVRVTVTDELNASATVAWSITVTTQGFKFLDAVRGKTVSQGGDGSIGNPWRSINDWYLSDKNNSAHRDVMLYYRNGTYSTAEAPIEDGIRMAMIGTKPVVWMAYPDESPVIDVAKSFICPYGSNNNLYFEGLTFRNLAQGHGVRIDSGPTDVVFRKNKFVAMPSSVVATTNISALMIANGGQVGRYWTLVDNQFSDFQHEAYGVLGYSTQKVAVERNTVSNVSNTDSKGIGPKTNNQLWFIRDNRIYMQSGSGIWIDTYTTTQDMVVEYNLVVVNSGASAWFGQENVDYGAITSRRNTFVNAPVRVDNLVAGRGPVSFDADVIVNNSGSPNGITLAGGSTSLLRASNVLYGSTSAGIVDSSGNLTQAFSQYLGSRGYQRSSAEAKPEAPSAVTVE